METTSKPRARVGKGSEGGGGRQLRGSAGGSGSRSSEERGGGLRRHRSDAASEGAPPLPPATSPKPRNFADLRFVFGGLTGNRARDGSMRRATNAWTKNAAASFSRGEDSALGVLDGEQRAGFDLPPEVRRIIREVSPPPEKRHGNPSTFLKRTADPRGKVFGNRRERIERCRQRPASAVDVWKRPHTAPLPNRCRSKSAGELPKGRSLFYRMWALGHFDFVRVRFAGSRDGLRWATPIRQLDAARLLPIFLDGLREPVEPARFIAIQGAEDLTYGAKRSQILAAAPACAAAIKEALHTREPVTVTLSLLALRRIVRRDPGNVVAAMLPFLAQFLSPIALFNGSSLEVYPTYDRHKVVRMQEAIDAVLHAFADHGGTEAAAVLSRHLPAWRQVNGTEAPSHTRKTRQQAPATRASTGVMPYTIV